LPFRIPFTVNIIYQYYLPIAAAMKLLACHFSHPELCRLSKEGGCNLIVESVGDFSNCGSLRNLKTNAPLNLQQELQEVVCSQFWLSGQRRKSTNLQ
jgi:hypothetical protein